MTLIFFIKRLEILKLHYNMFSLKKIKFKFIAFYFKREEIIINDIILIKLYIKTKTINNVYEHYLLSKQKL
jgi:hypothetical protein